MQTSGSLQLVDESGTLNRVSAAKTDVELVRLKSLGNEFECCNA